MKQRRMAGSQTGHLTLTVGVEPSLTIRNAHMLSKGPGRLSQAPGIDRILNGVSLAGNTIWIENWDFHPELEEVLASPRVGVDYAGEHAKLPWRIYFTRVTF